MLPDFSYKEHASHQVLVLMIFFQLKFLVSVSLLHFIITCRLLNRRVIICHAKLAIYTHVQSEEVNSYLDKSDSELGGEPE